MSITPNSLIEKKEVKEKKVSSLPDQKAREIIDTEEKYQRGRFTLQDLIAPSALRVSSKYLQLGDKYLRTLFVVGFPRYISVGWFVPVINFNAYIDVAMFFYPVESSVILKQLQNRVGNLQAEMTMAQEKGLPRDPLKETALNDIEQLRDSLTTGVEKFFQFGLYITIYAKDEKELDLLSEKVESLLASKLIYSRRILYQAEQGFNSTLPLCNDQLMILNNINSSPCASSFPFISADLTSDNGILYGINRHNNSLILFDRFSMPNANFVVFATSGAGKSYFCKLEVLRSMMFGTDVIIIDPEQEYKHLSDAIGGTYINISLSSKSKINPFDLPRSEDENVSVADIIRTSVITIKGLLRIMIGRESQGGVKGFTAKEDSIIDRALIETYAKKDIVPGCDLSQVDTPTMSDLQEILEGMEGGFDLSERLRKYTEGTFAGFLNYPTNVEMDNQLVVFSVRDIEDELRPMAIYTIVNYIWNIVRAELKKRILLIDEAWWLMQHEDSAKFIFALVKRCRKYYLGVTTITQDVNDFLESSYGRAIVTNSAMQLLLRQSPAAIDGIVKTFMLTEGEKYLLLECGIGDGIFFAGSKHAAIKIVASYSEDQLITSDPKQLLEIEEAKREFAKEYKKR
ncbi:conjugal transfer protein TraC [Candidatus Parcubacteria bacterium 4484_255]|nr:MAG: conjugal transfer protein TraC [Candidatus Parcubacteria bacterium 4484_255]